MRLLRTQVDLPVIAHLSASGLPCGVHDILVQRVEDCTTILNRIIVRWENFQAAIGQHEPAPAALEDRWSLEDRVRIEVIDDTFSFITFLFLLLDFYRGIDAITREVMTDLGLDVASLDGFPDEQGTIADLHTLRNKMVAHTAHLDPRKDSLPNRYAYLTWYVGYWGIESDLRNRRLNTFGVGVGGEESTHAIPPTFDTIIADTQSFIERCGHSIATNVEKLANLLSRNPTNRYVVLDLSPP